MISKLSIDRADDFRFHVAYLAYSQAWDENVNDEVRKKLNDLIESLSENRTDYKSFYYKLDRFRENVEHRRHNIKSQRKIAWRKREEKKSRIKRHKKK